MNSPSIRLGTKADAPAITELLNHYIANTTNTFIISLHSLEDRLAWFEQRSGQHPCLVAEVDGAFAGWGALSAHNPREGYRHSADVSVYVHPRFQRHGIGRALVQELISHARAARHHTLVAACCTESKASIALHQSLGFRPAGELRQIGRKFDRWLDVVYLQLLLD